ncbi:MAG: HD family phosphohydrolase [Gemmataceae bacterium]
MKKRTRLDRWNGQLVRSHDDPPWRLIQSRQFALTIAIALLTVLSLSMLGFLWGQPFPYRLGQTYNPGLQARISSDLDNFNRTASKTNLRESLPPAVAVTIDPKESNDLPARGEAQFNTTLLNRTTSRPIDESTLARLKILHQEYLRSLTFYDHAARLLGLTFTFSLLGTLVGCYVVRFQPRLSQSLVRIVGICAVFATGFLGALVTSEAPWYAVCLPLTFAAMVFTLAYDAHFGLVASGALVLMLVATLGTGFHHSLVLMAGVTTSVLLLRGVRTRMQLVKVAFCGGLAYFLMTLATGVMLGETWNFILADASRRLVWGALAGFLLTGVLPFVERLYGVVTDISLVELASGSHPLLQELMRRAPGTHTHSLQVATLAEAAAESIGANALLTRVGALFHDVGKMLKPQYFIENQNGHNHHDSLEPALSTLIIVGHVKDGAALARQYQLPAPIIDFIEQHHGTTLVEYFYREAMRLQAENGHHHTHACGELESTFRYPGPKPQTRESAIVMLADCVESASRCLSDPTPTRLRKLIRDLMMKRLLDSQFEESSITLAELHQVEASLCRSLTAIFHSRIKYEPEPQRLTSPEVVGVG